MTAQVSQESVSVEEVEKIAQDLLEQLEFAKAEVKVKLTEEKGVELGLEVGEEAGILIGYHGEGLMALQTILSLILYRRTGKWQPVRVDIDGYLKRRQEQLYQLAEEAAERVLTKGKSETLPYLSGNERRIVHKYLGDNQQVTTESLGEGRERRLVISPK